MHVSLHAILINSSQVTKYTFYTLALTVNEISILGFSRYRATTIQWPNLGNGYLPTSDSATLPLRPLWLRAVTAPSTIARAERNQIQSRPPPEEEDGLCLAATSHTFSALVQKCIADPFALTEIVINILAYGANSPSLQDRAKLVAYHKSMAKEDRDLLDKAMEATADEDETKARRKAWVLGGKFKEENSEAVRLERIVAQGRGDPVPNDYRT